MKYGIKLHSTMTDTIAYVIEDTEENAIKALELFKKCLYENLEDAWHQYCFMNDVFCDEDSNYSFMVGKLENGNHVLVTDLDCKRNEDNTTFEFKLVAEFKDRF